MAGQDGGMPKLHIFRPGVHTDMRGQQIEFSAADLAATAQAYSPAVSEAPLVVGHPDTNAPAYGWVKGLAFADTLQAEPDQVDPDFAELVNAGRFKKISASFYRPDAPSNPCPGVWYLRHVGFLGAAAPAVKGLKSASFAAAGDDVVEFGELTAGVSATMFRRLREWVIAKFGLADADSVVPEWSIGVLEDEARREATEPESMPSGAIPMTSYREPAALSPASTTGVAMPKTMQELEAELQAANARIAAAAAAETAANQALARANAIAFTAERVREGRLLPAHQAGVSAFLATLPADQEIAFAAADDKEVKQPARAWFEQFLRELPVAFATGEHAKDAVRPPALAQVAAPEAFTVDPDSAALHAKAVAFRAAHPDTDYITAVQAVANGG